jgi:hypothetical protein
MLVLALIRGLIPWQTDCRMPSDVDRAEALYLKKILSFVEWPSGAGVSDEPFRVCVAADYKIAFPLSEELAWNQSEGAKNRHADGPQGRQLKKLPGTVYRFAGAEAARKTSGVRERGASVDRW